MTLSYRAVGNIIDRKRQQIVERRERKKEIIMQNTDK
jgi:hypothetical protein